MPVSKRIRLYVFSEFIIDRFEWLLTMRRGNLEACLGVVGKFLLWFSRLDSLEIIEHIVEHAMSHRADFIPFLGIERLVVVHSLLP